MFPENRFMELLIIGALALIVVGPKDLPVLMRRVGQFVGKMRGMAAEFRASFDELARQSELEELRKEVEAMRVSQQSVIAQINPLADESGVIGDIHNQMMSLTTPPAALPNLDPAPEPVPAPVAEKPKAPRAKAAAKTAAPKAPTVKTPSVKTAAAKTSAKPAAKTAAKAAPKPAAKAAPRKSAPSKTVKAASDAS
jgi:sec-independent protein translocase protein TatB